MMIETNAFLTESGYLICGAEEVSRVTTTITPSTTLYQSGNVTTMIPPINTTVYVRSEGGEGAVMEPVCKYGHCWGPKKEDCQNRMYSSVLTFKIVLSSIVINIHLETIRNRAELLTIRGVVLIRASVEPNSNYNDVDNGDTVDDNGYGDYNALNFFIYCLLRCASFKLDCGTRYEMKRFRWYACGN